MNIAKSFQGLAAAGILLPLLSVGCAADNTAEMLKSANARLMEENRNLQAENGRMRANLNADGSDRRKVEGDVTRLQAQNRALENERARLLSELHQLRDALAAAEARPGAEAAVHADQLRKYRDRINELEGSLRDLAAAPPPPPAGGPLQDKPELNEMVKRLAREHGLTYDERTGMLRFPADLLFPSGQDALLPGAATPLKKLAAVIDNPQVRDFRIRIVGHTDKRPIVQESTARRFPSNWHLSCARSISVMAELLRNLDAGKDEGSMERLKDRFEPAGRGQRDLLDSGEGDDANSRNRRVEVYFVPPARSVASAQR